MKYLIARDYDDIAELGEWIYKKIFMECNNQKKLRRFIWDICPLIDSIREKYFRMLNKGLPIWELDYRLKREV